MVEENVITMPLGGIVVDETVDATGLACPMPLLKTKLALNQLAVGQKLKVLATDPGSVRDFHAFVELSPHSLLGFEQVGDEYRYILQRGESPDKQ